MTTGIVIPAHMRSTRFPGKPLADVGGRPLLSYAVEAARETGMPWCVATSDDEIFRWCSKRDVRCVITPPFRNGTERAAHINAALKWDRVIVLQCDEPDVTGEDLEMLARNNEPPCTIITAMARKDWGNHNTVAVYHECKDCDVSVAMQFKRERGIVQDTCLYETCELFWSRHVGVYLYHAAMLADYLRHPPTPAEESQSLEQLRTMAMGYAWSLMTVPGPLRSINVPEDVEAFK